MARILIIEDTPANLLLTMAILEDAGHAPVAAPDAETGIEIATREPVDLILMDMRLPGLDGFAATRRLHDDPRTRAIPVVALTASAMQGDEAKMRAAGCAGYIAKPVNYQELLAAIDGALAHPGPTA
jgi:two-component system cell cycle response regulator DivK